jgi:flagellar biosynthesis/type III secretory pathway ATPase
VDDAVTRWPAILEFLRQGERQRVDFASSVAALRALLDCRPEDAQAITEHGA